MNELHRQESFGDVARLGPFLVLASGEVLLSAAGLTGPRRAPQINSNCCPAFGEELVETWLLYGSTPAKSRGRFLTLTLRQDGVQPGFKILFTLGPQLAALDGQCAFDGFHPMEQLLDVLAGLGVIFLQVAAGGHPSAEGVLDGMVRGCKGIRRGSRRQQSAVPGKKVLE